MPSTRAPSAHSARAPSAHSTRAPSAHSARAPSARSARAPPALAARAPSTHSTRASARGLRVRYSIQHMQDLYDSRENPSVLENFIRAYRGIIDLPASDKNSFWEIATYHGEPFTGVPEPGNKDWWGGYCQHKTVLFPAWHRAYCLRMEQALQSIVPSVTLPFWDELLAPANGSEYPIPSILTTPTFRLDGRNDNPLFSYTFQRSVSDDPKKQRYAKPVGYQTVRYPLSGLVGTKEDYAITSKHNAEYMSQREQERLLNQNVKQWIDGTLRITPDGLPSTRYPDTLAVRSGYRQCLDAPNFTVFSNRASSAQYIRTEKKYAISLEEPHNSIHLSIGGMYEPGVFNADRILDANGDMGENETAAFDPIFFLHHCWVDYVFWRYQVKNNLTKEGSLKIIAGYDGTISTGFPELPSKTPLTDTTPLKPFKRRDGTAYTTRNVTNIEDLGYTYGFGSLDGETQPGKATVMMSATDNPDSEILFFVKADNVSRSSVGGSFVVRTMATLPSGKQIPIGREAVLSRFETKACANCQDSLDVEAYVPIYKGLNDDLQKAAAAEPVSNIPVLVGEDGPQEGQIRFTARVEAKPGAVRQRAPAPRVEIIRCDVSDTGLLPGLRRFLGF